MQTVRLNNGIDMPIAGFGTYQIADPLECEAAVKSAIKAGYRLIDTASAYLNEEAVGQGIRQSGIDREALFITTKLWVQDQGYESTKRAFSRSMERLQLDYLDLYLIHWPYGDVYGSWRAMEEFYAAGKIKAIGVSNFMPDRLMDFILHQKVVPAVNQIETHPFNQQHEAGRFMNEQGVQMQSWSPFAQGMDTLWKHESLVAIADNHQKSIAQVILRWLVQRNIVVIPKTINPDRMAENIDIFDFQLSDKEMQSIAALDTQTPVFKSPSDTDMVKLISELKFDI